jgi:phytanoyl-CoA hydroxylase
MASPAAAALTPAQLAQYERDGFLVLEGWWDADTVSALKRAAEECIETGLDLSRHPRTVFQTEEQSRSSDSYFLESGDKVRFFFEERAFSADGSTLAVPKLEAVNKVGHNLHELLAPFRGVSLEDPRVHALLRALGYEHPLVPQSMYILKPPRIGGAVNAHQDGTFLYTQPQSVVGLWWPLEACTKANGCLWAVPGSHARGVKRRFKRNPDGPGTVFDPPQEPAGQLDTEGAVPLEIPAGSLVLLHAAVVHFSHANESDVSRHAYSIHVIEGGKGVVYPEDNWNASVGRSTPFPALY